MKRSCLSVVGVLLGVFLVAAVALPMARAAGTETFSGAGMWSDPTKWSGSGSAPPAAGDDVVIAAGADCTSAVATVSSPLNSYLLSATAKHTILGTSAFTVTTTVTINGTLTHATNTAESAPYVPDSVVNISAATVTINGGGKIDVDNKGYRGGYDATHLNGYGPGAGTNAAGGGYGGRGSYGYSASKWFGGPTYGVSNAPVDPGSGGGACDSSFNYGSGAGGGAVHIVATGQVTVDGTISAKGGSTGYYHGAGSGGGVYIECATFNGTGYICADGGWGGGGGGGGRIAVVYSDTVTEAGLTPKPSVQFSSTPGMGTYSVENEMGTLYLTDASFYPYSYTRLIGGGQVMIPNWTTCNMDSLTVVTGAVQFLCSQLIVTNDIFLASTGRLSVANLNCKNVTATNYGALLVYASETNGTSPLYGGLVAITNQLLLQNNGYVYPNSHPTNGGSVKFTVSSMTVQTGGRFSADGRGFQPRIPTNGWGPGGGAQNGNLSDGGSYGGRGWRYSGGPLGTTYGSASKPIDAGSAGGSPLAGKVQLPVATWGGGGVVWVEATGDITVDGTVSANGGANQSWDQQPGGGSGGGVYLACNTIKGGGLIQASGGTGPCVGPGGGGRVAVYYNSGNQAAANPKPRLSFNVGAPRCTGSYAEAKAEPGSLYFPDTTLFPYGLAPYAQFLGGWQLVIPGFTSWSPDSLTISNDVVWLDAFTLTVTNTLSVTNPPAPATRADNDGGLLIKNATALTAGKIAMSTNTFLTVMDGALLTTTGHLEMMGATLLVTNAPVLNVGENLVLTNLPSLPQLRSKLHLYSGLTNGLAPAQYGLRVGVTGDLVVASGSIIYPYSHRTNGGSALFDVKNMRVLAGGQINADGGGFGWGPANSARGYGPGGTAGDAWPAGASYGGKGGTGSDVNHTNVVTYGSSNAPVDPGSGGGRYGSGRGGYGGGLVRIVAANIVQVDGTITAGGASQFYGTDNPTGPEYGYSYGDMPGYAGGAGSGGGIYIWCKTFSGTGLIKANGGTKGSSAIGGGGGGGRIAIWRRVNSWAGTPLVDTGVATGAVGVYYGTGEVGTVIVGAIPIDVGTMIMIR